MRAFRDLLCLVSAASALALPMVAQAQSTGSLSSTWQANWQPNWQPYPRSSLGLHLSRSQPSLPCGATALTCDAGTSAGQFQAGAMVGKYWGVELGYADSGRLLTRESRTQGLNLSLIGKAPLGQSLGVFGKLGTTYGRGDTSVMGAGPASIGETGFGLSYGAGLSLALTPRLSATLELDSNDYRLRGSGREPVRSTNLGLQYRY